jgi:hypothetical protein
MLISEWRDFLGSVTPGQVRHALNNLPEYAPNATQFKDLCWRAPAMQIEQMQRISIGAPQDLGDGPEAMERRQVAYNRFRNALKELL